MLLEFAGKRTSYFPCNDSIVQGSAEKQRARKAVYTVSPQIKIQLIQFIAIFFLSISSVSTEQWQLYAKNLRDHQDRTGELVILVGQSIVLGEVKAEELLCTMKIP